MSNEQLKQPTQPTPDQKFLEVKKSLSDLAQMYQQDKRQQSFNCLLYGRFGCGKTRLIETAPKPILVHSFDPGGSKTFDRRLIDSGAIIVDSRFEGEDDKQPKAWDEWRRQFADQKRKGIFNYIATFAIDSGTLMAESCLNKVKKTKSEGATLPEYNLRIIEFRAAIKECLDLPCNFILTAHYDYSKDDDLGRIIGGPFSGTMQSKFPLLFDEVYYLEAREGSGGSEYVINTASASLMTPARSRISRGRFSAREIWTIPPTGAKPGEVFGLKNLMKKAGLNYQDKEF